MDKEYPIWMDESDRPYTEEERVFTVDDGLWIKNLRNKINFAITVM